MFRSTFLLLLWTTAVLADSSLVSQFLGAATPTGPSSGVSASYFTICTNYFHDLLPLTGLTPSASSQLEQQYADGACQFCQSVGIARVDSCCAVATSSACFEQFENGASPATTSATTTAGAPVLTGTASTSTHNAAEHAAELPSLVGFLVALVYGLV